MQTRYISQKTAYLYESSSGKQYRMVLLFGDEVEVIGSPLGRRVPVAYRGRQGFVQADYLGTQPVLEMYAIDVGQGDATFIVTPGQRKILIDGGLNRRALGFLSWKYRLDKPGPPITIDLLVLSHADSDHLNGLVPVLTHPRILVRQVVHSGIAVFNAGVYATSLGALDPSEAFLITRYSTAQDLADQGLSSGFAAWLAAIRQQGCACAAVASSTGPIDVGDPAVSLEVLGPRCQQIAGQPAYRWFGDSSHTINGHSVVLRLTVGNVAILLPGDLNREGAALILEDAALAARLDAHVLKAPHHGSHEFLPALLDAIRPQISVISSGDDVDHGHPRANFVGAVGRYSRSDQPLVFSTEIAANFVEADQSAQDSTIAEASPPGEATAFAESARERLLFKRRLHGMINVRTDGQQLYAARRVAASYWWEAYGPLPVAPRSIT